MFGEQIVFLLEMKRFANISVTKAFFRSPPDPPPTSFVFSCSVASLISLGDIFSHDYKSAEFLRPYFCLLSGNFAFCHTLNINNTLLKLS